MRRERLLCGFLSYIDNSSSVFITYYTLQYQTPSLSYPICFTKAVVCMLFESRLVKRCGRYYDTKPAIPKYAGWLHKYKQRP